MPRISDTYESNSKFLKVDDLQRRKVQVTIADATVEAVGEANKIVLSFQGKDKVLPLNITNARMLEFLTGSDNSDDWIGLTITLKPDMTTYQGKPTPCIRIDSELPAQAKRTQAQAAPAGFNARDAQVLTEDESIPF
jgi:hypothetical protein